MDKLTHVRQNIKRLKDQSGGYKGLFEKLNGHPANRREAQTLTNNINRGVFKAEFIIQLIEEFGLEDVTLGEFFKGELKSKPQDKNKT